MSVNSVRLLGGKQATIVLLVALLNIVACEHVSNPTAPSPSSATVAPAATNSTAAAMAPAATIMSVSTITGKLSLFSEDPKDYTSYSTNTAFTVTMMFRNVSTATVNVSQARFYSSSGGRLSSTNTISINRTVSPNSTLAVSLSMRTPGNAGTVREDWQLVDSSGNVYLIAGSSTFWKIITVSANRVGWASATGYRWTETGVQRSIVAAAIAASGQSSGPSYVSGMGTTTWVTDVSGGDGQRMRNAINRYAQWYKANPKTKTLTQIKADMTSDFSTSQYTTDSKSKIVDQVVSAYNANTNAATPTTDQQTLSFLGMRKQCLEWTETIAQASGGKGRGYSAAGVSNSTLFRPGMGMYRTDSSHAMIVIDIYWDAAGNPIQFRVAESNMGSGWSNPSGMIPWQRTIRTDRIIALDGKIVSYE